jgi:DNA polymerase III epsilon subunit-like protein
MFIINDVETSGRHSWYHDVVSCGLVVLDSNLNIIDKFYEECCPWYPKNFDHETVEFHKFTLSHLKTQQSSLSMSLNILRFLNKYRDQNQITYRPFIYHALNRFDFRFMDNLFLKNGLEFYFRQIFHGQHSFSTIRMARQVGYDQNSLDEWGLRLGDRFTHHNALDDAIMASKVFKYLIEKGAYLESGLEIKKADQIESPDKDNKKVTKPKIDNEELICNYDMQNYLQA